MGLTDKIDRHEKVLPKEVLQFTGTLNHLAANLNKNAKKRNGFDELDVVERAMLSIQSKALQKLAVEIKDYLNDRKNNNRKIFPRMFIVLS